MARLGVLGLALVLAVSPAAAEHAKTDVVTTHDGSTYIGEIKSVQNATVTLSTHPAGTLSIEWRHVTAITSKFDYRVELSGGVLHFGTLGPAKEPGHLSIVGSSGPIEVELEDVVQIVPLEHGFWKRLDGSVNWGLSYTQSNDALQYNLSGDATYRTRKNLAELSGQSILNTQRDVDTTSQHKLQLLLVQTLRKRLGSFEVVSFQSNPAQGYDLRFLLGGGASHFFIENSHKLLFLSLGAVFNRENVTDSPEVDDSAEALVAVSFRRFKRGSHSPSVQLGVGTFTDITGGSRFRAALSLDVSWKIVGDFTYNVQLDDNYDTDPPGTDSANNDLTLASSIGYTF